MELTDNSTPAPPAPAPNAASSPDPMVTEGGAEAQSSAAQARAAANPLLLGTPQSAFGALVGAVSSMPPLATTEQRMSVLTLPPRQPEDFASSPLTSALERGLREGHVVLSCRSTLLPLLHDLPMVIATASSPRNVQLGFCKVGLFPYNLQYFFPKQSVAPEP